MTAQTVTTIIPEGDALPADSVRLLWDKRRMMRNGEFLDKVDRKGAGTNILHLVPHGSVRRSVMTNEDRAPTPDELKKMEQAVDLGMREGAWGMSTGLIYEPVSNYYVAAD